ncbi:unnamed protein product [Calypogeia fissa]
MLSSVHVFAKAEVKEGHILLMIGEEFHTQDKELHIRIPLSQDGTALMFKDLPISYCFSWGRFARAAAVLESSSSQTRSKCLPAIHEPRTACLKEIPPLAIGFKACLQNFGKLAQVIHKLGTSLQRFEPLAVKSPDS